MIQLDFGDHRPLYEQIKEKTKELIIAGALSEHDKVPSVRELASELAINPNTIQKAYKELESEGYIYSIKSKGSFVSPRGLTKENVDICAMREEFAGYVRELMYLGMSEDSIIEAIKQIYEEEKQ